MLQVACVAALAGLAAIWSAGDVLAQDAAKVLRIGILSSGTYDNRGSLDRALVQGLREQGYVEGKNLVIERRYDSTRIKESAVELAGMNLDAIVTTCTPSTRVMKDTTSSTPIVMAGVSDPVRQGIVASLSKPGRNVTGTSSQAEDILAKRLEYVAEIVPKGSTVVVVANANNPVHALGWQKLSSTASEAGLVLRKVELKAGSELEAAMEAAMRERAGAMFVMPDDPMMINLRPRLVEVAAKYRIADFYWERGFVDSGGLMSYGENLGNSYRVAAGYVDRIKKGAHPGEMPVEQPTRFELVINARRAQALGIPVPQQLLLRADEVIQ